MSAANDIEDIIEGYLPIDDSYAAPLCDAMNYSVQAGGKRIRPRLMLETYKLFAAGEAGASCDKIGCEGCADADSCAFSGSGVLPVHPFMAAIEMIHNYSLVHDDLPAMDNDELRRGKPTTWKAYGEARAILAGDGLLTFAFETAPLALGLGADPEAVVKAIEILAHKAGLYGMCGGQEVDVAVAGKAASEDMLMYIYRLKTGALLEASMMIGAVLGGADAAQVKTCEKIAADIGIAFQIRDDILDVTSTEAELGKPIGSDARNEKMTYVTLHGLDEAQSKVVELSEEAIGLLEELPGDKSFFTGFIRGMETRKS